jgi:hypothetical protein
MFTYKEFSQLLIESSEFRGEFWIKNDTVEFADSNYDIGHAGIAVQAAIDELLDILDIHAYDEPDLSEMEDEIYNKIESKLPNDIKEKYKTKNIDIQNLIVWYGVNVLHNTESEFKESEFKELVSVAYNHSNVDPRTYAMKKYNWKALRGTEINTWNFTKEDLRIISNGLQEAHGDDIDEYIKRNSNVDEHGYAGPYFGIEVFSRNDYYSYVPFSLIESNNISEIQKYKTVNKGMRLTENKIDDEIQLKLDNLSKKYSVYLNSYAEFTKNYIKLEGLLAKKNAPIGTGSSYMRELCDIADMYDKMIVLRPAIRGYGGFAMFKSTTSRKRLKNFYSRFGFVSSYSTKNYSPYLPGNMYREPKKI